ncbi:MAG TPA: hypothetical protein VGH74_02180 [Planctomycetaceae bacterium]|jgi:hypothetical protein
MESIRIISADKAIEELVEIGDDRRELDAERKERLRRFPNSVALEGAFSEYYFASRWCWQNLGACDGECCESDSEYPGCPLVLATERIENIGGRQRKKYSRIDAHVHEGSWTNYWLGKTDYDYGFCEFYFANDADRDRFIAAVPTFTWGENYDWRS